LPLSNIQNPLTGNELVQIEGPSGRTSQKSFAEFSVPAAIKLDPEQ
jgi:hypothetical protein